MRCLFLDAATRSGWAFGSPASGVEEWGAFLLPRTGENIGAFLCAAETHIDGLIAKAQPTLIAFESPFINRKTDTILKIRKLSGLANEIEKAAERQRIECVEAPVDRVRRHFLGRAYPRKSEDAKRAVRVRCRELGYDVPQESDEADAIAGFYYIIGIAEPKVALAVTPMFQKRKK